MMVEVTGKGPPVVLLASLGRSAIGDFAHLAAAVTAAGFQAVRVDPRTDTFEELTLHDLAADVASVCDERQLGPVHIVGHAYGNRLARAFAAAHPERVRTVTLLASGGKVPPDDDARTALVRCFDVNLSADEHLGAVRTAFFAPGNDPSWWVDGWNAEVAVGQGLAVERTPIESGWAVHTAPTLVVQGLQDRIAPPANGRQLVEELQAKGVYAELVELDGAGHALLPERPEQVAAAVIGFLSGHRWEGGSTGPPRGRGS